MSSEIVLWDPTDTADSDYRLDLRYENTTNTPLTSATLLSNGQEIADDYELTFTESGGAVTVDVVCGAGSKNPYTQTGTSVTADGSTSNTGVIGGVDLVVSASTLTGWKASVSIGASMSSAGVITDFLQRGVIDAGTNSTQKKIAAVNTGSADSVQTTINACPGFHWTPASAYTYVKEIDNHSDDTLEHTAAAGTYSITFSDYKLDSGTGKYTVDISVGGTKVFEDAQMDGTTRYESGVSAATASAATLFAGLAIILQDNPGDPTAVTVTLTVTTGDDWEEFAPDVSGSPGTWQTSDLSLTESGQATGTIRTGQVAYFWTRWNLPDSASPDIMRKMRYRIRGLTV